jgi:hypothetical protein
MFFLWQYIRDCRRSHHIQDLDFLLSNAECFAAYIMKYRMKERNYYLHCDEKKWTALRSGVMTSGSTSTFLLYSSSKWHTLYSTSMFCKTLKFSRLSLELFSLDKLSIWYQWGIWSLGLLSCYKEKSPIQ